jgi:iron complex transport system permease protein
VPVRPEVAASAGPIFLALLAALGLAVAVGVRSVGVRTYLQRVGGGAGGALTVVALALLAQRFLARPLGDAVLALYLLLVGPGLSALVGGGVLAVEALARRGVSATGLVRTMAAASLGALAWLLGFPLLYGQRTAAVAIGWGLALLVVSAWAAAAHGLGRGRPRGGRDRY